MLPFSDHVYLLEKARVLFEGILACFFFLKKHFELSLSDCVTKQEFAQFFLGGKSYT